MFKYALDQVVFYLQDNRVHSAPVLSRKYVDNKWADKDIHTDAQQESFQRFGPGVVKYATVHGEYTESKLFANREDLAASLLEG